MKELNTLVGSNLRLYRERLGLSQEALSSYLNITHATISLYENGKRAVPASIVEKSASLFGIDGFALYEVDTKKRDMGVSFAFRADELSGEDLEEIANFKTVVRNYLNMKQTIEREQTNTEEEDNS